MYTRRFWYYSTAVCGKSMDNSSRGHVRSSLVADKSVCLVHSDEQQALGEKHLRAQNLRTSLADGFVRNGRGVVRVDHIIGCLLYTSDAADE